MAPTGYMTPNQSGYNLVQTPRFSPEKSQQMAQLRGIIEPGYLKGLANTAELAGGDQSQFEKLEAPALRQFGELQGGIASRFSGGQIPGGGGGGAGALSARRSSGFQNTMGNAAVDLSERLQGQRLNFQQQALQQLQGLYSELTQDPYEAMLAKKEKPWLQEFITALAPGVGKGIGSFGSTALLKHIFG